MELCKIDDITSCYHYNFKSDHIFTGHTHSSAELNIILNGEMGISVSDRVFHAKKGDIFLYTPWVFHSNCIISESAELIVIQIEGVDVNRMICNDWYARQPDESEQGLVKILTDVLDSLLDKIHANKRRSVQFYRLSQKEKAALPAELGVLKRLVEVLVSVIISSPCNLVIQNHRNSELCNDAVRIMHDRITSKLTIDELSDELHVCPSVLKAAFSDLMGKGVIRYFTEMKIGEAKKLLEQGKSIAFVSDYLGFSAQNYFSTVFKRVTGLTPKQCRNAHALPNL